MYVHIIYVHAKYTCIHTYVYVRTFMHTYAYIQPCINSIHTYLHACMPVLGLKWIVNLLSGYPDANINYGYPTDSDIIKLALLAIHFNL